MYLQSTELSYINAGSPSGHPPEFEAEFSAFPSHHIHPLRHSVYATSAAPSPCKPVFARHQQYSLSQLLLGIHRLEVVPARRSKYISTTQGPPQLYQRRLSIEEVLIDSPSTLTVCCFFDVGLLPPSSGSAASNSLFVDGDIVVPGALLPWRSP